MMDHTPWISRLASQATLLQGRAHDFAQFLRDAPAWPVTPAAYVYPLIEEPGQEYQSLVPRQVVTATLAVLIVVAASGTTEQAFDTLAAVRASIKDALLGWSPNSNNRALFAGGEIVDILNADPKAGLPATVIWRDLYRCDSLLTL